MTTGITIDVEAICERPLRLFIHGNNAWEHMRDHALGEKYPGEEQGWRLLLPALENELIAAALEELRKNECPRRRLEPIYRQFLDCIQRSVEGAAGRNWYWELRPGNDARWATFGREGVLAYLDEDFVRTGFLPEKDPEAWSDPSVGVPLYRLFLACLDRVRDKYENAVKWNRIETIERALDDLLQHGLDEASWNALT
jgi:hypothetical protein